MWNCTIQKNDRRSMVQLLISKDKEDQKQMVMQFRGWMSKNKIPIRAAVDSGVVRKFVDVLICEDCSFALQEEATWILTNIAMGPYKHTKAVIDAGAVPIFVKLLESQFTTLRQQAVWVLGNIAAACPEFRNIVLDHGIVDPLLSIMNESSIIKNAVWTLRNLCRNKSNPADFAIVSRSLPTLYNLLFHNDSGILTDACWTISFLTNGPSHHIQAVINAGVGKRLVELLMHETSIVAFAALKAVGNIVSGGDNQTQVILNLSALPGLLHLLNSSWESVKMECCWTISNITAGTESQIQEVIDANIIPSLINILDTDAEFSTKVEAATALQNIISDGGSGDQIKFLVDNGCIQVFCKLLHTVNTEPEIIAVVLESLSDILFSGEMVAKNEGGINRYASMVKECSGYDRILHLKSNECCNVQFKNVPTHIIKTYFQDRKN